MQYKSRRALNSCATCPGASCDKKVDWAKGCASWLYICCKLHAALQGCSTSMLRDCRRTVLGTGASGKTRLLGGSRVPQLQHSACQSIIH